METHKTKESAFDRVIFSAGVSRQRWHNDGALNNACVISLTLPNCLSWSLMISRIQGDQVENVFSFVCSGERLGWRGAGCGAAVLWGVLSGCRVTLKALWGLMGSLPWAPVVAQSELTWRRARPKERNPVSHLEGRVKWKISHLKPLASKLSHVSWWFWASKKLCRTLDFKKILEVNNRPLHIPLPVWQTV